MSFQIAIDGPAGAGKSTIAKLVAEELSFIYIDTGAMYRAMGLFLLDKGVNTEDEESINKAVERAIISISQENGVQQVYSNGENVTGKLRTEQAGMMASKTSAYASVRKKLVALQKEIASVQNVVMDGRDIGTCVLPEAQLKIYLTAGVSVRAERRYKELLAKGVEADLDKIEAEIEKRDYQDMNRAISPLKKADDAVLVDSSNMTIQEVAEHIIALAKERLGDA